VRARTSRLWFDNGRCDWLFLNRQNLFDVDTLKRRDAWRKPLAMAIAMTMAGE
jgi:hypothetical protein